MKVEWTDAARRHLRLIHAYIREDSVRNADRMVKRLVERSDQLVAFPHSGRRVPETRIDDLRELIEPPYRIIYRIQPDSIEVVAVVHSSRKLG